MPPAHARSLVSSQNAASRVLAAWALGSSGWRTRLSGYRRRTGFQLAQIETQLIYLAAATFAAHFKPHLQTNNSDSDNWLLIAYDSRASSPAISKLLTAVCLQAGLPLQNIGLTALPELLACVKLSPTVKGWIYITASHNPPQDNGFKLGGSNGSVLPAAAIKILRTQFQRRVEMACADNFKRVAGEVAALAADATVSSQSVQRTAKAWQRIAVQKYHELAAQLLKPAPNDTQRQHPAVAKQPTNTRSRELAAGTQALTQAIGKLPKRIRQTKLQLVINYNGSARAVSAERKILARLGVTVQALGSQPGVFKDIIVPEGPALRTLSQKLNQLTQTQRTQPLFGMQVDADGDRGNIVFVPRLNTAHRTPQAIALSAQLSFALSCLARLALLKSYFPNIQAAFSANGATSLLATELAMASGSCYLRSETGEANVLACAAKLEQRGYYVALAGEGSNGGSILPPAPVRDPLAICLNLLTLLFLPGTAAEPRTPLIMAFRILQLLHAQRTKNRLRSHAAIQAALLQTPLPAETALHRLAAPVVLTSLITALSVYATTSVVAPQALLKLSAREKQSFYRSDFKHHYAAVFTKYFKQQRKYFQTQYGIADISFGIHSGASTRYTTTIAANVKSSDGGCSIYLKNTAAKTIGFLWYRSSQTEPLVRSLAELAVATTQLPEHDWFHPQKLSSAHPSYYSRHASLYRKTQTQARALLQLHRRLLKQTITLLLNKEQPQANQPNKIIAMTLNIIRLFTQLALLNGQLRTATGILRSLLIQSGFYGTEVRKRNHLYAAWQNWQSPPLSCLSTIGFIRKNCYQPIRPIIADTPPCTQNTNTDTHVIAIAPPPSQTNHYAAAEQGTSTGKPNKQIIAMTLNIIRLFTQLALLNRQRRTATGILRSLLIIILLFKLPQPMFAAEKPLPFPQRPEAALGTTKPMDTQHPLEQRFTTPSLTLSVKHYVHTNTTAPLWLSHFKFELSPGYHINAHDPLTSNLIPTTAALKSSENSENSKNSNWAVLNTYYSPPNERALRSNATTASSRTATRVRIYENGGHEIVLFTRYRGTIKTATLTLPYQFSYQVCSDTYCYPPRVFSYSASVPTEAASTPNNSPPPRLLALYNSLSKQTTSQEAIQSAWPEKQKAAVQPSRNTQRLTSLLINISLALLGGIILNFMPCVLPVVYLKLFALLQTGSTAGTKRQFRRTLQSFALGIHAVFALLALAASLLQLAGNIIGWGFQFQNPLYVFALLSLTWYMGLYLAGAYHLPTLSLSSTTAPPTSAPSVQREHFILGSVTALLATPCTAPLLAPAIGYFFSRTWWELSLGINLVGLGLALPYWVLGMSARAPAILSRLLPRPGAWMHTLKQLFAFSFMLISLWMLSILYDLSGFTSVLIALSASWGGAFILTLTHRETLKQSRTLRWVGLLLLFSCLAGSAYALLRPAINNSGSSAATVAAESSFYPSIPLTELTLRAARQTGQPVYVHITASWCLSCKVNERLVLASAAVKQAFYDHQVSYLVGDWTAPNPFIVAYLHSNGRAGLPFDAVYHANGSVTVLSELLTQTAVLKALQLP